MNLGMLKNLLGNFMEIFKTPVPENDTLNLDNSSTESLRAESPLDLESEEHPPEFGTCQYPGKIRIFAGASCYSNITLKFYFMNSRKFWNYALALGVRQETSPRVALVLVDSRVRVIIAFIFFCFLSTFVIYIYWLILDVVYIPRTKRSMFFQKKNS